ncbi:hypothetical protein CL655_01895 [bacterium]|nr:hypothetical protein [bacterium]
MVIAIIGIPASVVLVSLSDVREKSHDTARNDLLMRAICRARCTTKVLTVPTTPQLTMVVGP